MKKFNLLLLFALLFIGCGEIDTNPKEIKFDREVCHRCKMIISVRNYAAQTINPDTGKRFYWDDIGCAVLWFDEDNIEWQDKAITYVKDVHSGEWINVKEAFWTYGALTPMDYGWSAHKQQQEGKDNHRYDYVRDHILGKPL